MNSKAVSGLVLLTLVFVGCSKPSDTPIISKNKTPDGLFMDTSKAAAESAIATIGGAANASENIAIADETPADRSSSSVTQTCSMVASRPGPCTGHAVQTNWGNCLNEHGLRLSGTVRESYTISSSGAPDERGCSASIGAKGIPLPDGDSLSRVIPNMTALYTESSKDGALKGATVTYDTNPGMAWDGTAFPSAGYGTVITRSGLTRQVKINGLHEVMRGPHLSMWFEHTHEGTLQISGSLANSDRTIAPGSTLTTWNNTARLKIVHTFTVDANGSPVRWSASCCFPVQGAMDSVITGATITPKKANLTFTATCGQALMSEAGGKSRAVTLGRCL